MKDSNLRCMPLNLSATYDKGNSRSSKIFRLVMSRKQCFIEKSGGILRVNRHTNLLPEA